MINSKLEDLRSMYSDTYKDAMGFRPREINPTLWDDVVALEAEIDSLIATINFNENFEAEYQASCKAALEAAKAATKPVKLSVGLFDLAGIRL